jgi:hypothetical protein
MQQQEGYKDSMNDVPEGDVPEHVNQSDHKTATARPIVVDANRKLGRGPVIGGILAVLLLGAFIFAGIRTRIHAEETLTTTTRQDAILSVSVTTPVRGAAAQVITLPANTQAYIDTPIYARTNGYLRHGMPISVHTFTRDRFWPRSKRQSLTSRYSRRSQTWQRRAQTSSLHRLPPTAGRNCWPRMRSQNRKPIRPRVTSMLASLCCRRLRPMYGDCSNSRG